MMNRLGIFCFYNDEGIVESYVEYLLESMKKIVTQIIIVINGNITQSSQEILKNIRIVYMLGRM